MSKLFATRRLSNILLGHPVAILMSNIKKKNLNNTRVFCHCQTVQAWWCIMVAGRGRRGEPNSAPIMWPQRSGCVGRGTKAPSVAPATRGCINCPCRYSFLFFFFIISIKILIIKKIQKNIKWQIFLRDFLSKQFLR